MNRLEVRRVECERFHICFRGPHSSVQSVLGSGDPMSEGEIVYETSITVNGYVAV